MNYYERHLGDFAKDTAHLSALEVGVYDLLIDRYYASESPIPQTDVLRIARARSKDERAAVAFVLAEFFSLEDGVYRQKRIDAEIEKYLAKEPTREKAKKDAAERQSRARKRRADLFERLREHEIVPPMTTATHELQAMLDDVMSRVTIKSVTRDDTLTSHQSPVPIINPIASDNVIPGGGTLAGSICARLKNDGVQGVNPQHPKLLTLLAEGLTADEITALGPDAASKGKGFAWVLAAAEGRRRDAAAVGTLPAVKEKPWFILASKIEERARELGVSQLRDEVFPVFRDRVYEAAGVTAEMVRKANIDFGARV